RGWLRRPWPFSFSGSLARMAAMAFSVNTRDRLARILVPGHTSAPSATVCEWGLSGDSGRVLR
ncbi:MAG: hypothetical protein ACOH14_14095, partial [Rhodoglobus sp.]